MKKIIATLAGILAMINMTGQVFASDTDTKSDDNSMYEVLSISNPIYGTLNNEASESTLIINGKSIKVKSSELKIVNNNLMVPLKTTAESLGFKVTFDKDSAVIDNDEIKSDIHAGYDSYSYYSSHAIGATAPQCLGAAPVMENGVLLVPIKFYTVLFNDSDAVGTFKCTLNDNKLAYIIDGSIKTGWVKNDNNWYYINTDGTLKTGWIQDNSNWYFLYDDGTMAADTTTPDGYNVDSSGKWDFGQPSAETLPNLIVEYRTVEEAEKAVDFKVTLPQCIPEGYKTSNISVISNKTFQIFYKNSNDEILFRMGRFHDDIDISGDYNTYEKIENIDYENLKIQLRENNDIVYSAIWSKGDMKYSINAASGMDKHQMLNIIKSIN